MQRARLCLTATILCLGAAAPSGVLDAQTGPVETRPANAPDQRPAFEGQTRAPRPDKMPDLRLDAVAEDLPHLWSMEFLPDGRILAAAKAGTMHIIDGGKPGPALQGVPPVAAQGQGGLLDIALAPDFKTSGLIFFSFSEPRDGGNGTSVAAARLTETGGKAALQDTKVIFRQTPAYRGDKHFGSRLVFAADNTLYVTVGERSDAKMRVQAQQLSSGLGKVFRIDLQGRAALGNPFTGRPDAQAEIWSYGHRNMQAAALDGQGRLWTVEHGPRGGDELNMPRAGRNYGWPIITYGIEYSGAKVGDGLTAKDGMEQPVYYWDPVIGPSGMAFYDKDRIPEWKGAFLIGGLVSQGLVILHLDKDRVKTEARLPLDVRIRDVKVSDAGDVYVLTEERGGGSRILRLSPEA